MIHLNVYDWFRLLNESTVKTKIKQLLKVIKQVFIISRYQHSNDKKDILSIHLAQQQTSVEMSIYINFYFNAKLT